MKFRPELRVKPGLTEIRRCGDPGKPPILSPRAYLYDISRFQISPEILGVRGPMIDESSSRLALRWPDRPDIIRRSTQLLEASRLHQVLTIEIQKRTYGGAIP